MRTGDYRAADDIWRNSKAVQISFFGLINYCADGAAAL